MKRARAWLEGHGIDYRFHDYKTAGITPETLRGWADRVGWEALVNRTGTTFRKLPEEQREGLDQARAIALMVENPSCIKRPIVEYPGGLLLGFREGEWTALQG